MNRGLLTKPLSLASHLCLCGTVSEQDDTRHTHLCCAYRDNFPPLLQLACNGRNSFVLFPGHHAINHSERAHPAGQHRKGSVLSIL